MVAQSHSATVEDLDQTPDDGQIYELIDGVIVVSPAPSYQHQKTSQLLSWMFQTWNNEDQAGDVIPAPIDVILADGQTFQPDLIFVATENSGTLRRGRFDGVPDVAVEIIPPTSRSRDWLTRGMRYAAAGVMEYWVIDPALRTVSAHDLRDGIYVERPVDDDGLVTSGVLVGVRVDPADLFARVDAALRRRGVDV